MDKTDSHLVRATHLEVGYVKGRSLFAPIDFELPGKSILWVRGPNGIGKTSLIRAFLSPRHVLGGNLELSVSPDQIAYLPQLQNRHFHIPLTLGDVCSMHDGSSDMILGMIDRLMPKNIIGKPWNEASGGERKRALIVRALASKPKLLLLDEPFSHVDEPCQQAILSVLSEIATSDQAMAVVMVEHEEPSGLDPKLTLRRLNLCKREERAAHA